MPSYPESTTRLTETRGFTLVELLVAMTILSVIAVLLLSSTGKMQDLTSKTSGKIEEYQAARSAFDRMSRVLGAATLNDYIDYYSTTANLFYAETPAANLSSFVPQDYRRYSDLHYLSGSASTLCGGSAAAYPTHAVFFQAPLGYTTNPNNVLLHGGLNAVGYFIRYTTNSTAPSFSTSINPYRFCLQQMLQPMEKMGVYTNAGTAGTVPPPWLTTALASVGATNVTTLARNVIALVVMNQYTDASGAYQTNYVYNSRAANATPQNSQQHRLPRTVKIALVAIDEQSAQRLCTSATPPSLIPNSLFITEANYSDDLKTLGTSLAAHSPPISYRIFTTEIPIKSAR